MNIKACIFDIDGTLVPPGASAPSARTIAALRRAREKGIAVIIATGRALFAARAVLGELSADYYSCANGGILADTNGKMLTQSSFTQEEMYALVDFCEDHNLAIDFIFDDGYYAYVEHQHFLNYYGPFQCNETFLRNGEDQTRHLQSMPYGASVFMNADYRARFLEQYGHLGLNFVTFYGDHCDVLRPGANKAVALEGLLAQLGVTWEETAAFGDGNNDVEMLEHAGLAVVMENGSPRAKEAADQLAPPTEEDGVAWAMEQYIL